MNQHIKLLQFHCYEVFDGVAVIGFVIASEARDPLLNQEQQIPRATPRHS
jgi:hypothetical protein